mgnify:CR=1 FL=1
MWLDYLLPPFLGAVIGYFTNMLAVSMLFRPYTEKRIWGVRLPFTPGLIPKQKDEIASNIAVTISSFLLNESSIGAKLTQNDRVLRFIALSLRRLFLRPISSLLPIKEKTLLNQLKLFLRKTLVPFLRSLSEKPALQSKIASYINDEIDRFVQKRKKGIMSQLIILFGGPGLVRKQIPQIYHQLSNAFFAFIESPRNQRYFFAFIYSKLGYSMADGFKLKSDTIKAFSRQGARFLIEYLVQNLAAILGAVKLEQIIENQIKSFPVSQLEDMVLSFNKKHLKYINYLGGLLGFLIGALQLLMKL